MFKIVQNFKKYTIFWF